MSPDQPDGASLPPLSVRRHGEEVWVTGAPPRPADAAADAALVDQLRTAVAEAAEAGATAVHWEVDGDAEAIDRVARAAGLTEARRVVEMRRPLPLERPLVDPLPPLVTRPLRPGGPDEEAWVRTNRRAFRSHPSQGRETLATLRETMSEPWFRAEDVLLVDADPGVDDGGTLAGSCWTKVHPAPSGGPRVGEIFVIGVDPDHAGQGLGRRLVIAGLEHLARRCDEALLYVESDNDAARALYASLGFAPVGLRHVRSAAVAPG